MAAGDRCTKRIRKAAYSLYFDLGCNAMQIQREVCPTFSIRTVKRMIKEFEETFTWQPKKTASRAGQRVLCSKSLDALSEMLTGDPTLYLSQSVPSFTLGGLVFLYPRCANSGTNWTFSAVRL